MFGCSMAGIIALMDYFFSTTMRADLYLWVAWAGVWAYCTGAATANVERRVRK
jgi:hypothetical protein